VVSHGKQNAGRSLPLQALKDSPYSLTSANPADHAIAQIESVPVRRELVEVCGK